MARGRQGHGVRSARAPSAASTRSRTRAASAHAQDHRREARPAERRAFHEGSLYVMAIHRVFRYDGIEANPANDRSPGPDFTDSVQAAAERSITTGSSSPSGRTRSSTSRSARPATCARSIPACTAQIRRYNPDGSGMEIVARGVRNSVGFDFHPKTGELWFTDNGRDWAGEDGPEEELNRVPAKIGRVLRLPVLPRERHPRPGHQEAERVRQRARCPSPRSARTRRRSACASTPADMFPSDYRKSIFVARHGSWNKTS